jgi:hypothetical protein
MDGVSSSSNSSRADDVEVACHKASEGAGLTLLLQSIDFSHLQDRGSRGFIGKCLSELWLQINKVCGGRAMASEQQGL